MWINKYGNSVMNKLKLCLIWIVFSALVFAGCDIGFKQDWNALKITIKNEAQLRELATLVNAGNDFKGKIITLAKDINIKDGNWIPIGTFRDGGEVRIPFNGVFDGNGKVIKGVIINDSKNCQGLFGYIGETGTVKNIGVIDINITGNSRIGGLTGHNDGTVENSYATGDIMGTGYSIGGLVGSNNGIITNSYATGSVTGTGTVGGLAGYSEKGEATIMNSHATGNVTGAENVGGLVGYNERNVTNSYATGNVTGTKKDIGGLAGYNDGVITSSYATGNVTGENTTGGLVGGNAKLSKIKNSYATGNVTGTEYVGGLVGHSWYNGTVMNSYAMGSVIGIGNVGGLMGCNYMATITNSYAIGNVTGTEYNVGGFVGYNESGVITNSYAMGKVSEATRAKNVSGFVGFNYSNFTNTSGIRTAEQMKQQSNYYDWDFIKVWEIDSSRNNGFPYLRVAE
jgi:hypothetical protein